MSVNFLVRRFLSSNVNLNATGLSSIVKQLSKFASQNQLVEYSQRPINYCLPHRMIEVCSPDNPSRCNIVETARELHDQLLVRLAHCLCHFQSIPFLPAVNPTLLSLHERYLKLFEILTKFGEIQTEKDEERFFEQMNKFLIQNNDVIGLLSTGCSEAQKYFKSYQIMKNFLDNVLRLRLSMRILVEHYLEIHKQNSNRTANNEDLWRGGISMKFSLRKTIEQCVEDVSSICFQTYSVVPPIQIEDFFKQSFPYFPTIVEYILRELLKNSMRALVESNKLNLGNIHRVKKFFDENRDNALCRIVISSDPTDQHFTIAVKDQGGGIQDTNENIFRYMFSGDLKRSEAMQEEEEGNVDVLADFQERMAQCSKQMFGYGFGLPICRLYAQMFDGTLTLQQVSQIGTDAYLRLGFIHTNSQEIKI